ncbi:MAG: class I SAM-dependent methyltransferase [Brumimicrobium sp.]
MSEVNKTFATGFKDYELIDAGGNRKLERWGEVITIRPERQAYFQSGMPFDEWNEIAHLEFVLDGKKSGKWKERIPLPKKDWEIGFRDARFILRTTNYKHIGLFPEQVTNWKVIDDFVKPEHKVLNLFAYTGASSIISKLNGADVTHVDSVKQLISWARENMEASSLDGIRWVHEDAMKFAQRELKRGNKYDLILMDPPAWGVGAKKEKWKIEDKLDDLMNIAAQLLSKGGLLIMNTYSPKVELYKMESLAKSLFDSFELSELWMETFTKKEVFYGHLLRARKA